MIALGGISAGYGARTVLRNVDLRVAAGEVVALLGANGAGKSTLLRIATGESGPRAGRASLLDRDLATWRPGELARSRAVLPQGAALAFPLDVRAVVELGLSPWHGRLDRGQAHRLIRVALDEVGCHDLIARPFGQLSGGQQQLVQCARVLAQVLAAPADAPTALFLDEPTASLDLAHQGRVLAAARRRARAGSAVLAVLHDLPAAAAHADRIVLLAQGRVLADGPPAAVLTPALIRAAYGVDALVTPVGRRHLAFALA